MFPQTFCKLQAKSFQCKIVSLTCLIYACCYLSGAMLGYLKVILVNEKFM